MSEQPHKKPDRPSTMVEQVSELNPADMDDLCDATDAAIVGGGGFGWIRLPSHDILERYWRGVLAMPSRMLFVARLDGVICGTAQLMTPSRNNEAQSFAVTMSTVFIAPWARGKGLSRMLVEIIEQAAREDGYSVINLDVRESQEAAIKLYESMGYVHFGTHPAYARVHGELIPGRYYYKILDSTLR